MDQHKHVSMKHRQEGYGAAIQIPSCPLATDTPAYLNDDHSAAPAEGQLFGCISVPSLSKQLHVGMQVWGVAAQVKSGVIATLLPVVRLAELVLLTGTGGRWAKAVSDLSKIDT